MKGRDATKHTPNSLERIRWWSSCSAGLLHAPQHALDVWYKPLSIMAGLREQQPLNHLRRTWTTKRHGHVIFSRLQIKSHMYTGSTVINDLSLNITIYYNKQLPRLGAISSKCQSNYGRGWLIICQVIQEWAGPHCEIHTDTTMHDKIRFQEGSLLSSVLVASGEAVWKKRLKFCGGSQRY